MPNYQSSVGGVNLEDGFVREFDMIDRFVGNQLWVWGFNTRGELGANDRTHRSSPVQTISSSTNWVIFKGGGYHSVGLKTDGTLWCWGHNDRGQLGDNSITHRSSPVQTVLGGTNWKMIDGSVGGGVGGGKFTAAVKTDGTLWTWGGNNFGQLGKGDVTHRSSPVQVGTLTNWKIVKCGQYHGAAITTDGTIWSWGNSVDGQLGDNSSTSKSSPVQELTNSTNWSKIDTGLWYTAAIKTDGTLWLWGHNSEGQLGDGTVTKKSSPVQTISGGTNWKTVACGGAHTMVIKTDGTLWTWGRNDNGQLGDGTIASKSSPIQTIAGGTNWKIIDGTIQDSIAIKIDGTLWSWGRNAVGTLGDGTQIHRSSPVQIGTSTNWKTIGCGAYHMAAVKFTEL